MSSSGNYRERVARLVQLIVPVVLTWAQASQGDGGAAHARHLRTHTWSGVRLGEGGGFVCEAEERARVKVTAVGLALARLRRAAMAVRRRVRGCRTDMAW